MSLPLVSTSNVPAYILHTQPFDSEAWGCWDRWLMRYTHLNEDALLNASDVTLTLPVICCCLSAGSRRGSSYFPTEFLTLSSPLLLFASWSSRQKKWKAVIHICQVWFLRCALIVMFKLPAAHAHINPHAVHRCLLSARVFERHGKRVHPAGTHVDSKRTFNQRKTPVQHADSNCGGSKHRPSSHFLYTETLRCYRGTERSRNYLLIFHDNLIIRWKENRDDNEVEWARS